MAENMSRAELVEKLENIYRLYDKTQDIQAEMDDYEPDDNYERTVVVPQFPGNFYHDEEERALWQEKMQHEDEDSVEFAALAFDRVIAPKEPAKPKQKEFEPKADSALKEKQSKVGCLANTAIGVAIFFALGAIVNAKDDGVGTIWVIAIIAAALFVVFRFLKSKLQASIDAKIEKDRQYYEGVQQQIQEDYDQKMKAYEAAMEKHKQEKEIFVAEYAQWREIYLESLQEEAEIADRLEEERQAEVNRIYEEKMQPAQKALEEANDLVSERYLPATRVLAKLIQEGRADDVKEAINLYEELVYRERQLQLQQEQEEQRRYEEELRRQDEERHHQEQMKFQQEQEYQRQKEAERQLRQQEAQHKEEMQMREKQMRQEAEAAKASRQKRCVWCAHSLTCRQQYYEGAYNCTGFTPKK